MFLSFHFPHSSFGYTVTKWTTQQNGAPPCQCPALNWCKDASHNKATRRSIYHQWYAVYLCYDPCVSYATVTRIILCHYLPHGTWRPPPARAPPSYRRAFLNGPRISMFYYNYVVNKSKVGNAKLTCLQVILDPIRMSKFQFLCTC